MQWRSFASLLLLPFPQSAQTKYYRNCIHWLLLGWLLGPPYLGSEEGQFHFNPIKPSTAQMFSLRHCSQLVVVVHKMDEWEVRNLSHPAAVEGEQATLRWHSETASHWGKSWTAVSRSHYIQNFCNMVFSMSKSWSYLLAKPMTRSAGLLLISMQEGIRNQAVTEWNIPCPTSFIHRQ